MTSLQKAVEMMNIEVPVDYSLAQWQESLRPGSLPVQAVDLRRDSSEFPNRKVLEAAIIQLLRERGGSVKIRTRHWNIYDELADRLGCPFKHANDRLSPRVSRRGAPKWLRA